MSRSDTLLFQCFTIEHRVTKERRAQGGKLFTDAGSPSLWRYLTQSGYVLSHGPGPLGHRYTVELTEFGRARVQALIDAQK